MCRRNGLRRKVTVLVNPGNIGQTEATLLEVRDAARLTARALGIEAPETLLATADEQIAVQRAPPGEDQYGPTIEQPRLLRCTRHFRFGSRTAVPIT